MNLVFFVFVLAFSIARGYQIGIGRSDVTGPAAEVHFVIKILITFFQLKFIQFSLQYLHRWDMPKQTNEGKEYIHGNIRELSLFRTMQEEGLFMLALNWAEFHML
jgi:hypothetical protein